MFPSAWPLSLLIISCSACLCWHRPIPCTCCLSREPTAAALEILLLTNSPATSLEISCTPQALSPCSPRTRSTLKPSQAKPSQAKPSQAKSSQIKPNQAKPRRENQAKSSQAKSSQIKPSPAKPNRAKSSLVCLVRGRRSRLIGIVCKRLLERRVRKVGGEGGGGGVRAEGET